MAGIGLKLLENTNSDSYFGVQFYEPTTVFAAAFSSAAKDVNGQGQFVGYHNSYSGKLYMGVMFLANRSIVAAKQ